MARMLLALLGFCLLAGFLESYLLAGNRSRVEADKRTEPLVPPESPLPPVKLHLGSAAGTANPHHTCVAHAGGGNILVVQLSEDTIATSMTGVVVAKSDPLHDAIADYTFELTQNFEVISSAPKCSSKLILEARVMGLLRNPKCCGCPSGSAAISIPAHASVHCGPDEILSLNLPSRSAASGENLSVYNREGPLCIPIVPGKYTLYETFGIQTTNSRWSWLGKGPSAEFAPDRALDTIWISKHEPFHGAIKKNFGFQVIIKVVSGDGLNVLDVKEIAHPLETKPAPKPQ